MSTTLAQARLRACRYWPFASHAILSMVPVARPGLGTLAVDQHWRLYYDESALEAMGTDQAAAVILHELDHLLKRHHKRGRTVVGDDGSRWELWNYATDATINEGLRTEGVLLPDGVVYPEKLDLSPGLSAEEYFRSLISSQQASKSEDTHEDDNANDEAADDGQGPEAADSDTGSPTDDQGTDDSSDEGSSAGTDASAGQPGGDLEGSADEDVTPQTPGASGSCSDGQQRPWELGLPTEESPGLDEADQEQLVHVTAQNVLERECGNGSSGRRRWAEAILNPPVDPAAKLLNLVRRYCDVTVGLGERSYRRPSRRNGNPRISMPSNVAPLPRITVIIDTSGSMGHDDLALALGMIRKVLHSFRIRDGIKVITGDSAGQTSQICLSNPQSIELVGGGGTDMSEIVDQALGDRPRPQLILICTDGWTPWPTEDRGVPIVACLTNPISSLPDMYQPPNWIVTLELQGA